MKTAYVYILASRRNGTLYTGVTIDLIKRICQHRVSDGSRFTSRYRVRRLVYYEVLDDIREAIAREKRIKEWQRAWKIELIERSNPDWRDLYSDLL